MVLFSQRYGREKHEELVELWGRAKELVKGKVVAKVVDEMWTYLYKNARAFYKWVFTCYVYTKLGVYLILGDRDELLITFSLTQIISFSKDAINFNLEGKNDSINFTSSKEITLKDLKRIKTGQQ